MKKSVKKTCATKAQKETPLFELEAKTLKKTKSVSAKKVATKKVATKKVATKKVAVKKTSSKSKKITKIVAHIDIGWGNSLFIRGEGSSLVWDKGVELECTDNIWTWASSDIKSLCEFKLLINDEIWSIGDNYTVKGGETLEIFPCF